MLPGQTIRFPRLGFCWESPESLRLDRTASDLSLVRGPID
jgi:hypothetical protein